MQLISKARKLIGLQSDANATKLDWVKAENDYEQTLASCDSSSQLREAVHIDVNWDLPIDLYVKTYEKLLKIDKQIPDLRALALYLEAHSPPYPEHEWRIWANQLEQEADMLEKLSQD